MRVIQLKKSKVLKFASIGLIGTFVLFLMARHFGSDEQSSLQELLNNMNKQNSKFKERNAENIGPNSGRIPNKSHPDEVATFTGTKPGNFEPVSKLKVLQGPAASEPGENGRAHKLRVEQKQEEEKLKGVYGFNQLASDEITLNRTVPDLREPECQFWDYPKEMPKASVILVFHNEGWSTLFRTVNSVINRSPPQFFEEVVLVDDKSEMEHLHERLDEELKKPYYKGRVKLVRNKEREGLIRSRNNGAIAATGEVRNSLKHKH
jgi:polypeptide N-acetylgalactosaminyltransferase